jgi:hypothetical protein
MIVDENLNDCSNRIVKRLRYSNILLIIAEILALTAYLIMVFKNIDQKNEIKRLKDKITQEEQMLSLEYSIGYWFINKPEEVNDSILYAFLVENKAWYPDILLKQAKIESGDYKSNVFKNSNNLYGMKRVGLRNSTQRGTYNGYGVYDNWCLSVLDRMLWDIFRFDNEKPSEEEYLKAMRIYAEDTDYIRKIK